MFGFNTITHHAISFSIIQQIIILKFIFNYSISNYNTQIHFQLILLLCNLNRQISY
jgi:hypothetical protein